jgi:hypothetical protein
MVIAFTVVIAFSWVFMAIGHAAYNQTLLR